jgi:hypothetical protein
MIEIDEKDFTAIERFHLSWRWIDRTWNRLAENALSKIRPLREEKAHELWRRSLDFCGASGLSSESFTQTTEIDASRDEKAVNSWLRRNVSNRNQRIIVSWDRRTAVVTEWDMFCAHWDDFCYPSSDDVAIWPDTEEWALRYYYKEVFCCGRKRDELNQNSKDWGSP